MEVSPDSKDIITGESWLSRSDSFIYTENKYKILQGLL